MAPSQQGSVNDKFFVSQLPLLQLLQYIGEALTANKADWNVGYLRPGDRDPEGRDLSEEGDGRIISVAVHDHRKQVLTGILIISKEFDSPGENLYVVSLQKRRGDNLAMRKFYNNIMLALPRGAVLARNT